MPNPLDIYVPSNSVNYLDLFINYMDHIDLLARVYSSHEK